MKTRKSTNSTKSEPSLKTSKQTKITYQILMFCFLKQTNSTLTLYCLILGFKKRKRGRPRNDLREVVVNQIAQFEISDDEKEENRKGKRQHVNKEFFVLAMISNVFFSNLGPLLVSTSDGKRTQCKYE